MGLETLVAAATAVVEVVAVLVGEEDVTVADAVFGLDDVLVVDIAVVAEGYGCEKRSE